MPATPPGRDWTRMGRADFDDSLPPEPPVLIQEGAVRSVPAVPDECGTAALFGDRPAPRRPRRSSRPTPAPSEETGTLF
ncbi:hypothetical protein LUR56_31070 [Streptomyces sp. MT29]|nr:hypothetical protein [Streptomyces sp. MT29]